MEFYITNKHFTTTQFGINFDYPSKLQRLDLRDYLLPYLATFETEPEDSVPTDTVPTDTIITPPDTTSIPQFGTDGFRIYPNPVSNQLHIDYPQDFEGANYEIMNLSGQKIAKGILREKSISLNNKHFKAGKYILVIRGKNGTKSFIFIKKE
ncbi:MAG: T9SS type A sorting domain-containing protein [Bacteroidales bacterium]|nr:T9SS type A sorting domain-containing protein [Bacteroidales bacterium]